MRFIKQVFFVEALVRPSLSVSLNEGTGDDTMVVTQCHGGAVHLSWLHTVADALPNFLCPFCALPPLLPVVGRGLVYCLRIAVFIPSAYLCPLFISLIYLLSTFLEPSALPPHSLQCSEVDTEGKHTLNLQWPGSPCAQCASSSSSAYSKPQLASPAHLMEFLVHFGFCTTPLPTNNVFPR